MNIRAYVSLTTFLFSSLVFAEAVLLTQNQQQWLDAHPDIHIGIDSDFYPIEFVNNNGDFSGVSADITQLINSNLNINMRPTYGLNWTEVIQGVEDKSIDVLSAMAPSGAENLPILFTKPYMGSSQVVITTIGRSPIETRKSEDGIDIYSLESLYGEKVSITKGYPEHEKVIKYWPKIDLLVENTTLDVLLSLSEGRATAAIVNLDTALPLIYAHNLSNLSIEDNAFNDVASVHFAVRDDWPELVDIINTVIDHAGNSELERIARKWRSSPIILGFSDRDVLLLSAAFIFIIIIILLYLSALKRVKNNLDKLNRENMDALISQSRHVVMGEMIAMLTHQWRQPLTILMLEIGVLREKIQILKLTTKERNYLTQNTDKIEAILDEQNSITREFRDFFHPNKEGTLFNLKRAVKSSIEVLDGLLVKSDIKLDISIDEKIEIIGVERDLRHVIINIGSR